MADIQRSEDCKEFFFGEIRIDKLESDTQSPWKADIEHRCTVLLLVND